MSAPIDPHKLAVFAEVGELFKGTDALAQRLRVRAVLERGYPLTTFDANRHLGVYHCPARVLELRREGLEVLTHWVDVQTESGTVHRVGQYLLSREARHAE